MLEVSDSYDDALRMVIEHPEWFIPRTGRNAMAEKTIVKPKRLRVPGADSELGQRLLLLLGVLVLLYTGLFMLAKYNLPS